MGQTASVEAKGWSTFRLETLHRGWDCRMGIGSTKYGEGEQWWRVISKRRQPLNHLPALSCHPHLWHLCSFGVTVVKWTKVNWNNTETHLPVPTLLLPLISLYCFISHLYSQFWCMVLTWNVNYPCASTCLTHQFLLAVVLCSFYQVLLNIYFWIFTECIQKCVAKWA